MANDLVKFVDFEIGGNGVSQKRVVEIFVTAYGTFQARWEDETIEGDLHTVQAALRKHGEVKARKIRIDCGLQDGRNVLLVGVHANGRGILARKVNDAGKLVKADVDRWANAFLVWDAASIAEKNRLDFAAARANEAVKDFMNSRKLVNKDGKHINVLSVIQEEVDMPETVAKRLLGGQ